MTDLARSKPPIGVGSVLASSRMLSALLDPPMPAPADPVEVVAAHLRAVAIEVDANLVPRAAPRAAPLIRERWERRDVDGFSGSDSASRMTLFRPGP